MEYSDDDAPTTHVLYQSVCDFYPPQDKSGEEAENTVYYVLRQRHMKEAIHLEDQLARQRKAQLAAVRAEIRDRRAEDREKLQAAYDKVQLLIKNLDQKVT